jgi:hypothetical protein
MTKIAFDFSMPDISVVRFSVELMYSSIFNLVAGPAESDAILEDTSTSLKPLLYLEKAKITGADD